jgi:hypothetical protein
MFVVSVVCCQVVLSATSLSLVQRSPTDYDASLCVKTLFREILAVYCQNQRRQRNTLCGQNVELLKFIADV